MIIQEKVHFKSSAQQVWDLLTLPAFTQKYMFGCEVISDWEKGSPILWKGKTENGEEIIYVKGEILACTPGQKVTFTMFDPNMGLRDIPENYINLTYEVADKEDGTLLTITQGDYTGVENAEKRFEESKRGWEMVIPGMKALVE